MASVRLCGCGVVMLGAARLAPVTFGKIRQGKARQGMVRIPLCGLGGVGWVIVWTGEQWLCTVGRVQVWQGFRFQNYRDCGFHGTAECPSHYGDRSGNSYTNAIKDNVRIVATGQN